MRTPKQFKDLEIDPRIQFLETRLDGYLVRFPIFDYDIGFGGHPVIHVKAPDGWEFVDISVGLDHNFVPPRATRYLKPIE